MRKSLEKLNYHVYIFIFFSKRSLSNSMSCVICLEPFASSQKQARCPGVCAGTFHSACLNTWLLKSPTCPTCRTSFGIAEHTGGRDLPRSSVALHTPNQDGQMQLDSPPRSCPECGHTRIVETNHGTDQVCTRCGLVVRSVYRRRRR